MAVTSLLGGAVGVMPVAKKCWNLQSLPFVLCRVVGAILRFSPSLLRAKVMLLQLQKHIPGSRSVHTADRGVAGVCKLPLAALSSTLPHLSMPLQQWRFVLLLYC